MYGHRPAGGIWGRAKIVDRWFYDLHADPNKTAVQEWQTSESGSALLARVSRELGVDSLGKPLENRTDLGTDELEALRELGYVE